MKISSLKIPNLATVLFALVILDLTLIGVQCRTRRSPEFSSRVSDRINSPNLEIAPREALSCRIEYKIGNPNNLVTAPRQLSPKMGNSAISERSQDRISYKMSKEGLSFRHIVQLPSRGCPEGYALDDNDECKPTLVIPSDPILEYLHNRKVKKPRRRN